VSIFSPKATQLGWLQVAAPLRLQPSTPSYA